MSEPHAEEGAERARRLSQLTTLRRWVVGSLDREEALQRIVAAASRLIGVPYARLWLLDGEELVVAASEGATRPLPGRPTTSSGQG